MYSVRHKIHALVKFRNTAHVVWTQVCHIKLMRFVFEMLGHVRR